MTLALSINTIRQLASAFSKEFEGVTSEKERDQDFMRGFCAIFGINPNRIDWQYPLKELNKVSKKSSTIWADGVLRGTLLIEMKSAGKDLEEAYIQASGYVSLMNDKDRPDYILVSDFANLHLYNRITGAPRLELKLTDLPQQIEPFLFLANYETIAIEQQVHINKEAAETMAKLHDAIKATGYNGKDLETYLVRLLFCLFAEDTGLFGENGVFLDYLVNHTQEDGSDLHHSLMSLFDTLNKPDDSYLQDYPNYTGVKRLKNLPEHRAKFPYINGQLFAGTLAECCFDEAARKTLIDCAKLDWSHISPAIFGSLFQIPVAFVSTNSLTQGEQVAILWTELLKLNIKLHFAHRTFRWSNEGKGVAAVHCVIMGFATVGEALASTIEAKASPTVCRLFNYGDDIAGEPIEIQTKQINPYLVDAPTVLIDKRQKPLCLDAPKMTRGSSPVDGGNLLMTSEEVEKIRVNDLIATQYIRLYLMGDEFINGIKRYCLWLKDSTAQDRKLSPEIKRRMLSVKAMRLASTKIATQKLAETPYLFGEIRTSSTRYLAIPKVSSERRAFIPIGYLDADVICGDKLFFIPDASLFHFGVLTSHMHNAWMRTTCCRLKSDYSYSNTIVYNNFPWPETINPTQQAKIETAAQLVLDARIAEENRCAEQGQKCSLATLYAAGNMPTDLLKAHAQLDKAVDVAYGYKGGKDDAARVAFLFEQYQKLVSLPHTPLPKPTIKPSKATNR